MLSLAALGRSYLDETVSARGGVRIRIMERPARWMNEADLAQVVVDVQAIVRAAIPAGELAYGVPSGDHAALDSSIVTIAYDKQRKPIGFNTLSLLNCELRGAPVEVLHLGLTIVDPSHRGAGVPGLLYGLTAFLTFARGRLRPLWVSNVTQVPAVFGMVNENFDNVFPGTQRQTYDHLHLARQIMARYRNVFGVGPNAEFVEDEGIIRNAYTGGSDNLRKSFDDAAKHRTESYNDTCRLALDYERGDDFLQIGQVTLNAFRRFFTRSSAALAPIHLLMRFMQVTLDGLVAPVWQWFAADARMGDLRPAHSTQPRD